MDPRSLGGLPDLTNIPHYTGAPVTLPPLQPSLDAPIRLPMGPSGVLMPNRLLPGPGSFVLQPHVPQSAHPYVPPAAPSHGRGLAALALFTGRDSEMYGADGDASSSSSSLSSRPHPHLQSHALAAPISSGPESVSPSIPLTTSSTAAAAAAVATSQGMMRTFRSVNRYTLAGKRSQVEVPMDDSMLPAQNFQCKWALCRQGLPNWRTFRNHVQGHIKKFLAPLTCRWGTCTERFNDKTMMVAHLGEHVGESIREMDAKEGTNCFADYDYHRSSRKRQSASWSASSMFKPVAEPEGYDADMLSAGGAAHEGGVASSSDAASAHLNSTPKSVVLIAPKGRVPSSAAASSASASASGSSTHIHPSAPYVPAAARKASLAAQRVAQTPCKECGDARPQAGNVIVICDCCRWGYHQMCHYPFIPREGHPKQLAWVCRKCGGADAWRSVSDRAVGAHNRLTRRIHLKLEQQWFKEYIAGERKRRWHDGTLELHEGGDAGGVFAGLPKECRVGVTRGEDGNANEIVFTEQAEDGQRVFAKVEL